MSQATYLKAAARYRDTLNLIAAPLPGTSRCGICGHPDRRHRTGDALTERIIAGETAAAISLDYNLAEPDVQEIVLAALLADPRRHKIGKGYAHTLDLDLWWTT
jgi:hypothetical protein